jgi:hypothetical protein
MARIGWIGLLWLGQCLLPVAGQGPAVPLRTDALRRFEGVAPDRVAFGHLTIEDGRSQNAVYALLQDRQGSLWIGTTDGLNRYDGYAFTVFRHDPFDPATLSSSYVTAVLEDTRGHFWVGTQDGGLNRLDRATGAVCCARSRVRASWVHDKLSAPLRARHGVACVRRPGAGARAGPATPSAMARTCSGVPYLSTAPWRTSAGQRTPGRHARCSSRGRRARARRRSTPRSLRRSARRGGAAAARGGRPCAASPAHRGSPPA